MPGNNFPVPNILHLPNSLSAVFQHLDIQHCTHTILHTFDSLLEHTVQILDILHLCCVQLTSCSSLGNACIVRHRVKRDVDLLVGGLGAQAIGMDQQQ